ncbi:MAG: cysteine desulfurase family protein [Pseudomonadota bacterium]
MEEKKEIYLDYHATTPVLPQVLEAMSPYFCNHFGNANSTHQWGWKAEMAIAKASKQVADLIGSKASQVYFTSGATESLHWAIVGWVRKNPGAKVIATATEHKATYGACDWAKELGAEVVILPVNKYGQLQIDALEKELQSKQPTLISFIYGNNEIGTLNPIKEICALKEKYPHFVVHADAAQCIGKVDVDFTGLNLDFMSFSGHKLYGPKGIGSLVIKEKESLEPLFSGGGQQRNMRAGTTDVPSIVGLGVACLWASDNMILENNRLIKMRDETVEKLLATGQVTLNGHPTERLPNNMNLTFKPITVDKLLLKLPKVGFSSSSACSSGAAAMSHVLQSIGLDEQQAQRTIRFGMGHGTTQEDMDFVTNKLLEILKEAKDFAS